MTCGIGLRQGSGSALLWLWHGPAAVAPIRPLAWKLPYAAGVALKKAKKKKKKERERFFSTLETKLKSYGLRSACIRGYIKII